MHKGAEVAKMSEHLEQGGKRLGFNERKLVLFYSGRLDFLAVGNGSISSF